MQAEGKGMNCSVTDDVTDSRLPWKQFIGLAGYEEVSVYEGGWGDATGIWRPEEWSIMMGNNYGNEGDEALYYNAPSRWEIYRTIHRRAGVPCSFDAFVKYDRQYNVK